MKTIKYCIICREPKATFSREHIFPQAAGGDWVIHSICADCNASMGKSIDSLFVNSPSISIERFKRQIKRGSRNIKSPSGKKVYHTPSGQKYKIEFSDGTLQLQFLPHTSIDYSSGKPIGKLSYPSSWGYRNFEEMEKFKKKFINEYEEKTGEKIELIIPEIIKSSKPLPASLTEKSNDNPLAELFFENVGQKML